MNNQEYIGNTFGEIHAPEELFGKVMNMDKKEMKKKNTLQYTVTALAAFAVVFMASNGICYAATGQTWVTKAIVTIDGERQEQNIEWKQEGDTAVGTMEPVEGEEVRFELKSDDFDVETDDIGNIKITTDIDESSTKELEDGSVSQESETVIETEKDLEIEVIRTEEVE